MQGAEVNFKLYLQIKYYIQNKNTARTNSPETRTGENIKRKYSL